MFTKVMKRLVDWFWWRLAPGIRLRLDLRTRRRRHGKLWARIRTAQEEAKDSGRTPKEVERDYEFEIRDSSDDITEIKDRLLLRKAAKHGIGLDDFGYHYVYGKDDDESPWDQGVLGQQMLGYGARKQVESALRKIAPQLRRERRETIQMWATILFGLIGALTGLLAVTGQLLKSLLEP